MTEYNCYILYSTILNKYYTGSTSYPTDVRLKQHLQKTYGQNKFTASADDWSIFLDISCISYEQAMQIEKHIKKMKSRKYIENLKRYPEIITNLLNRFKD